VSASDRLYPYQHDAVKLIRDNKKALIAYEMGLGKTPITIVALEQMMLNSDIQHPVLVVVLSSLKYQWRDEISRWAPDSVAKVVDGTPAQRDKVYLDLEDVGADYVITTYDLIVRDYQWYAEKRWGAMVLDEMTAIKSFRAKRTKAVKELASRIPVRVGLTGTPITNGKAEEIFSLMEFVDPKILGKFWDFDKRYISRHPNGWVTKYRNMPELNNRIKGHLARKRQMDADVKDYLPDVLDMDPRYVAMDKYMERVYKRISADCSLALDEAQELFGSSFTWNVAYEYGQSDQKAHDPVANEIRGTIMACYSALRMLCDHPQLLMDSAREYEAGNGDGTGSSYCWQLYSDGVVNDTAKSPKLTELVAYVKDAVEADPDVKVVVFASFTRAFPYIVEALEKALGAGTVVEFSGKQSAKVKEINKKRFQNDPSVRVFLSSDAGGYGVDLPQASILINYNLPWSAGTALQRNSRIIRASSGHKQVRIERLLMSRSVEVRQWEMLRFKMSVAGGVVDGLVSDPSGSIENTVEGLRNFLLLDS
jgi:SNF2 family DNA or RNA helicase